MIRSFLMTALLFAHTHWVSAQETDFGSLPESDELSAQELVGVADSEPVCKRLLDVMSLAARRSPDVAVAEAEIAGRRADVTSARALSRPQVSAFARTQTGDAGLTGNTFDNQVGLRASQRIYDFGDARFAREAAEARVQAAELERLSVESEAAFSVSMAYVSALEADARLKVTNEREAYFSRQLAATEIALDRGGATRSEVAEIAARLAEAQAERFELEFLREQFTLQIATRINEQVSICTHTYEPELPANADGFSDMDTDLALVSNPTIERARRDLAGLRAELDREKLSRLPVVEVVAIGSYTYLDQVNEWEFRDRIGLDVSVPLFSGSALDARRQSASAEVNQAQAELIRQRRQLREDILITRRRVLSLSAQSVRRDTVENRKRDQFEAGLIEFDAGLKILPELVEDRLDYEQSRLDAIEVQFNLLRERLTLFALTGQILQSEG
ncbi:MAG: TolC family protein [Pseudomonadota bacterium]